MRYWVSIAAAMILEMDHSMFLISRTDRTGFLHGAAARNANEIGSLLDVLIGMVKVNQFRNGQRYSNYRADSAADVSGITGGRDETRHIYNAHPELFNRISLDLDVAFDSGDIYQHMRNTGRYHCIRYMTSAPFLLARDEVQCEIYLREILLCHSGLFDSVSTFETISKFDSKSL